MLESQQLALCETTFGGNANATPSPLGAGGNTRANQTAAMSPCYGNYLPITIG